ncbi:MAG TPA: type II toxin-antitoxin system HicB family antitoxin [Candidatus Saccharimonadales bacterium]|nr:type II toxin-antitoxin system HicB family antitoxin [Candidatus Saccharimonadales bacterium]
MNAYAVVIEGDGDSFSGYCPGLPGCAAAGGSPDAVLRLMGQTIPLHVESLRAHGEPVPPPQSPVEYIQAF